MTDETHRVQHISELARDRELTVATSESLTSGTIAKTLGVGAQASEWFCGGIVAYQERVKFDLLGVPEGPVVTAECAEQMALGARKLLGADVVVSATGVGGPDPSEGEPPGTVYAAVAGPQDVVVRRLSFDGDPDEVLDQTVSSCLAMIEDMLQRS
jgi:nicotinamide-nucleotide amidase